MGKLIPAIFVKPATRAFSCTAKAVFVSGVRVRPAGPKEPGDALRACSKMRGGRFFRVGASRLTHTAVFVVAPVGAFVRQLRFLG